MEYQKENTASKFFPHYCGEPKCWTVVEHTLHADGSLTKKTIGCLDMPRYLLMLAELKDRAIKRTRRTGA